ncbi:MAG: type II secretion system F family protein [Bacilli bacterium]
MKGSVILSLLIIQIVLILSLIGAISYILITRHNIALERKYSKYTLSTKNIDNSSFMDRINEFFFNFIHKVSLILNKISILRKYSTIYEKHIKYEEMKKKTGMDYISIKFFIGFFLVLLYLIGTTLQYTAINIGGLLISFLIGFFILDLFVQIDYKRRRKEIENDLLKAIIIMNNAFKSGRSIMQAIELVKTELDGSISDEFKKISLDMTYGLSTEVVFNRFYERVKLEDAKYITTSLTLLNKTGGNIVKVFASIEREFFDKKKLNNELKTLTSSSMFVYRILLVLPFVMYAVIFILNKDYFKPLYKTEMGLIVLFLVFLLYVLYILVIKKIVKVMI